MNEPVQAGSCMRTLRLKVRAEAYAWLNAAAVEVNQVFNWANATSIDAADRNRRAKAKWLSGFDLCNLSAGATEFFERIGAGTIQRICVEYATKRRAARRVKLRWRVSRGARRSLGWVPFKAANLRRRGVASHDRDVNAARNILIGSRCLTSVRGNESAPLQVQPSQTSPRCEAGTEQVRAAA